MIRSLGGGVPGTVVVVSLALLGSFAVIRQFYPHSIPFSRHNKTTEDHPSDDSDSDNDNEQKDDDQQVPGSSTVGQYFPWEPNYRRDVDNLTKPGLPLGRSESKTTTPQSCHEQLDFLASMTFANGGIRAPSCPCCI